jgi:type III secretion protein R
MLVIAALSLLPFALLMVTCFVRISVVLSILRSAIGAPQVPPTPVLTGLALVLTLAVMAPTGERIVAAVAPALPALQTAARADAGGGQTLAVLGGAADRAKEPLRAFLLKHAAPRDRATFHALALKMRPPEQRAGVTDADLAVVVPAFVTSELRRAFEIGFLLFIPFLVIDMVVANLLLALGMHMLSPTTVSLPFKLLLFVVADGWTLVVRGLMESYL